LWFETPPQGWHIVSVLALALFYPALSAVFFVRLCCTFSLSKTNKRSEEELLFSICKERGNIAATCAKWYISDPARETNMPIERGLH
jgi:hypothetical protein